MQQKRDPDTVSQLLTQIRELQDKVDFLSDAREFHDPESGSSSGQSHVPNQKYARKQRILISSCDGSKEIEIAQSIDDLITPRSILGKTISQIVMSWMR